MLAFTALLTLLLSMCLDGVVDDCVCGSCRKNFCHLLGHTDVLTFVCVSSGHDVDRGDGEPDRRGAV